MMNVIALLAVSTLKLGSPFTDHAVLQREKPVPICGNAVRNIGWGAILLGGGRGVSVILRCLPNPLVENVNASHSEIW